MSDDFWDGFDFPTLDTPTGSTSSVTQPIEQTPGIDTITTDLKKRAMVVFFIIDISGSMKGNRIQAVNDAIRNLIPELKKREASNTNAEIRVAILEFLVMQIGERQNLSLFHHLPTTKSHMLAAALILARLFRL